MPVRLRAIAHSRTGDKGDISNISVIVYDQNNYHRLERHVTAERVRRTSPTSSVAMWCAMRCPASAP